MIDAKLFTVERLLATLIDQRDYHDGGWRNDAEIITQMLPAYGCSKVVVKCGDVYLRHSKGPRQGHSWDTYGDDYQTPELALIALLSAPPPPHLMVWPGTKAI